MHIRKAKKEDVKAIVDLTPRAWEGATVAQLMEERHRGVTAGKKWYEYKATWMLAV